MTGVGTSVLGHFPCSMSIGEWMRGIIVRSTNAGLRHLMLGSIAHRKNNGGLYRIVSNRRQTILE